MSFVQFLLKVTCFVVEISTEIFDILGKFTAMLRCNRSLVSVEAVCFVFVDFSVIRSSRACRKCRLAWCLGSLWQLASCLSNIFGG